MEYQNFRYLFPPRPEVKAPQTMIKRFEGLGFIAQPKLNGSCGLLFTNGKEVKFMNRHQGTFSRELINREELLKLHRGKGWMVLCGEFMNKSQRGADRKIFNAKFVIFDIIVYNGKHLKDSSFWERQCLLDSLYEVQPHDKWINKITETTFRVKNLEGDLENEWKDLINVEMYEGFVLKKREGKLEQSFKQKNNIGWQVKIRKPTKLYKY
jgi:hypothetical protein